MFWSAVLNTNNDNSDRFNIMEQLRVKLSPSNPQLHSKKGVWGGKVKIINNVCNCGFQEYLMLISTKY